MMTLFKRSIALVISAVMMMTMITTITTIVALPVFAASETKGETKSEIKNDVVITYRDIKVSVDGKELIFTNLEGEKLEPFIAFSTVYVSASAAARALGKNSEFAAKDNILKINNTAKAIPVKKNTAGTNAAKKTNVTYKNIRVFIDGQEVTLTDMQGNKQEPFIAFDTVYVPLTALAKALGKTTSVTMGESSESQQTTQTTQATEKTTEKSTEKPTTTQKITQAPTTTKTAVSGNGTYVITETGKKYHYKSCRTVKQVKQYVTIQEAKSMGYEACKVCNPPSN